MVKSTKSHTVLGVSALTLALGAFAAQPAAAASSVTVANSDLAPIAADQLSTLWSTVKVGLVGHHDHDHAALNKTALVDDHLNGKFDV